MTILIENEVDAKFDFDYEDIAKKVINTSIIILVGYRQYAAVFKYCRETAGTMVVDPFRDIRETERRTRRQAESQAFRGLECQIETGLVADGVMDRYIRLLHRTRRKKYGKGEERQQ